MLFQAEPYSSMILQSLLTMMKQLMEMTTKRERKRRTNRVTTITITKDNSDNILTMKKMFTYYLSQN
jgi:hypothetical protein